MAQLEEDAVNFEGLARDVAQWSSQFQAELKNRPVAASTGRGLPKRMLALNGNGARSAFDDFTAHIAPQLSASAGPRYLGFVTGGATPASIMADWLVAATDQNVAAPGDSIATEVELQAASWLLELFELPSSFEGILTSGATASNVLGALCARQHAGSQQNLDIAKAGLSGSEIEVFAATPHASMQKAFSFSGLGRDAITFVPCLPNSEKMDTNALKSMLKQSKSKGKIVVASAGTVTGTDFDDLREISKLCKIHKAWLHVDGAFGLFARLMPSCKHWTEGIELADSITADAHKWLNVPYDCGIFFCKHPKILQQTCSVAAPYLDIDNILPAFMDRGIENSRRFRALPVWMSLLAYGKNGYQQLVEKNCAQALALAKWISDSNDYELLVECKLNVVVFRPVGSRDKEVKIALKKINSTGKVYMTPGIWQGEAAIRAAFSNWQTSMKDVKIVCNALESLTGKDLV
ncbi:aminotransferase class I/II-fold pyridoxal phosphate-dependent enzyme [uncultured Pseudoteredinibacter sp.]|uniref:pyridoxal phosphate-dependent decarboxylase family protein n=1 Tax=uncultured Pseudoteredinibacter sp. TaxID=1641701 RepID=UPI00260BAD38|nr:aminotransferase class I/II-fold pyridoxal phosphate-dependent enzyme [uncultured Pseudoteredinibacter sp.]